MVVAETASCLHDDPRIALVRATVLLSPQILRKVGHVAVTGICRGLGRSSVSQKVVEIRVVVTLRSRLYPGVEPGGRC